MVLDEKKKKALDKQLEFLLGQTERWVPFIYLVLQLSFASAGTVLSAPVQPETGPITGPVIGIDRFYK